MTVEVVPEKRTLVCNHCGARSDTTPDPFEPEHGEVLLKRYGHDWQGAGYGAETTGDLCAACTEQINAWLRGDTRSLGRLRRAFFSWKEDVEAFTVWLVEHGGEAAPPEASVDSSRPGNTVMGYYLTFVAPAGTRVNLKKFKGQEQR